MEIRGRTVLVLGGYGEVGIAVCRQLLVRRPQELVLTSLTEEEAGEAVAELKKEFAGTCAITPFHGNLFVRHALKDIPSKDIVASGELLRAVVHDNFSELDDDILQSSTLYQLVTRHRPSVIVDCVTTASALSYVNIYGEYESLAAAGPAKDETPAGTVHEAFRILATTSIPALTRHVQVLYEAMKEAGTHLYIKIGTTGTGGMGFNIPFTHGEKNPSRLLMTKTAIAGAHSMLLFAFNRIPGWPVIKEIKPAAMIGWKNMGRGKIARGGRVLPFYDCSAGNACLLTPGGRFSRERAGDAPCEGQLEGTFVDTGENGVFSIDEFKVITALGLMEFVTPEEIAQTVIDHIVGTRSSKDVIDAIDGAVMDPTYRAGFLREYALKRLESLGPAGISYGFLGPFISKLVFEATILKRGYKTVETVISLDARVVSEGLARVVEADADLRREAVTIGMAILMPDGERLLCAKRSVCDKEWEARDWIVTGKQVEHFAANQWIDLRPAHVLQWQQWLRDLLRVIALEAGQTGSRPDRGNCFWQKNAAGEILIDPGEIVAWVLIQEYGGGRFPSSDPVESE